MVNMEKRVYLCDDSRREMIKKENLEMIRKGMKKEERDQILYGMFNRLLKARRQQYKGERNAAARALNDTYADVGILFNINPITIRHILSRMDHGEPAAPQPVGERGAECGVLLYADTERLRVCGGGQR